MRNLSDFKEAIDYTLHLISWLRLLNMYLETHIKYEPLLGLLFLQFCFMPGDCVIAADRII